MGVIYSIMNPKGQIYIGATKNLKNRILLHRKDSKKKKKSTFLIYISISTYGWDNHEFSIVEEVKDEQLKEREIFWIKELQSYAYDNKNGLNMTLGGNHSISGENSPKYNPFKNIDKRKKKNKKKKSIENKKGKRVVAYSLDGNYIGDYSSCNEAVRKLGLNNGDAGRVARGTSKSTNDYIFKFHNGLFDLKIDTSGISVRRMNIPIVQINENGTVVREYKSSAEAGRILNICRKKIHKAANQYSGKANSSGYLFMTKEEYTKVINN